jgi:hypothetical protein
MSDEERAEVVQRFEAATREIEQTVSLVDRVAAVAKNGGEPDGQATLAELNRASGQIFKAVERVEAAMAIGSVPDNTQREG